MTIRENFKEEHSLCLKNISSKLTLSCGLCHLSTLCDFSKGELKSSPKMLKPTLLREISLHLHVHCMKLFHFEVEFDRSLSFCIYYQDPSVTTSQQITPVGSRKRKRRKLKDTDLSDLLSPESPLFRTKRKSGDLLSVSGSLLDNALVSPATPKGSALYQLPSYI